MADIYTKFSFIVRSNPAMNVACEELYDNYQAAHDAEEEMVGDYPLLSELTSEGIEFGFECDTSDPQSIHIYAEANGETEAVAAFVHYLLNDQQSDEVVLIEYSMTTSKMIPEGFGGGAIVVSRNEITYINPRQLALKEMDKMKQDLEDLSPKP